MLQRELGMVEGTGRPSDLTPSGTFPKTWRKVDSRLVFSQERIDNCIVHGSMPGCGAFLDAYSLYEPNGAKLVFDNVYYRITMQVAN